MSSLYRLNLYDLTTGQSGAELVPGSTIPPLAPNSNILVTKLDSPGKAWNFYSQVDADPIIGPLQSLPMLFNHRAALNLSNGSHTLRWNDGTGAAVAPVQFNIQPAAASGIGINADAINAPLLDPRAHPLYLPFFKAANITSLRTFTTTGWKGRQAPADWDILAEYAAAGIDNGIVFNFQNNGAGSPPGEVADAVGWVRALPTRIMPNGKKIIKRLYCGNEIDTSGYFQQSQAARVQYVKILKAISPVCRDMGIELVLGSMCKGTGMVSALTALGAGPHYDRWDYHCYDADAAGAFADIKSKIAYGTNTLGKPTTISETGTMMEGKAAAVWAAQQQILISDALSLAGADISFFSLYYLYPAYGTSPFDKAGQIMQPFYNSFLGGFAGGMA